MVDYVLVGMRERSTVSDVTILMSEDPMSAACLLQHKLLVCRGETKKKRDFVRKSKIHKLKAVNVLQELQKRVKDGAGSRRAEAKDVEGVWNELKTCLIDSAREACGESKGPPMHKKLGGGTTSVPK